MRRSRAAGSRRNSYSWCRMPIRHSKPMKFERVEGDDAPTAYFVAALPQILERELRTK